MKIKKTQTVYSLGASWGSYKSIHEIEETTEESLFSFFTLLEGLKATGYILINRNGGIGMDPDVVEAVHSYPDVENCRVRTYLTILRVRDKNESSKCS